MIRVENASKWSLEQLAPYMSGILEQFGRLARQYPKDCTMMSLYAEVFFHAKKALWLVLDDDALKSVVLTHVGTIDATGAKIATACDMAGDGVFEYIDQLNEALEAWGDEQGCDYYALQGRDGWRKPLKRYGYEVHFVIYRKKAHGNV